MLALHGYAEHVETRKQLSLQTSDEAEALRLLTAKNEAAQAPRLNLALARTYLSAHDQRMVERSRAEVMVEIIQRAKPNSRSRYERAMRDKAFELIRARKLVETTAEDFLTVLRLGKRAPTTSCDGCIISPLAWAGSRHRCWLPNYGPPCGPRHVEALPAPNTS